MKTVFTNDEIPYLWAHKTQSHARGAGSISFRDETGYSYAMPICRHATAKDGTPCVLFTTDGYSVTTSKHKSMFARAIPHGVPVFFVNRVRDTGTEAVRENVKEMDKSVVALAAQVIKTRAGTLKAVRLAEVLNSNIRNRNSYAQAFGLKVKLLDATSTQTLGAKLAKDAEKAQRKADKLAKEREQRERADYANDVAAWLNGEQVSVPYFPWADRADYLRASGEEMETSQGARVPLSHAKRAVRRIVQVRASGQAWQRNGATLPVGHYHIDSISEAGDVVAGCHRIAWSEIERFAKSQGWVTTV